MRLEQRDAVLELAFRKISETEFFEIYGIDAGQVAGEVIVQLGEAMESKDSDVVEYAMILAEHFRSYDDPSFCERIVSIYRELLVQDWHEKHEDIIRLLQRFKDRHCVAALEQVIDLKPRLGYLDHDEDGVFYKKCLWMLQDIGTPDAIAVLRKFSESGIPELRENAMYRLSGR